ncbi:alpha/beta hydrolase [Alkalihalobacillus sp. 1P02AB]|uniref:alpha/beta hydrolase n=1 Tax=Alkalihalobacillus sp. 1P02AB TaxID=3132260 RepID=UPI0039A56646
MMTETMFPSFDGTKLYVRKDIVDEAKAAVVIVHGLCEHLNRYDYLTNTLNARGFNVYRFDHRGHARSEGKRTFYSDFNVIIDDVNANVDIALQENPTIPVFVIGHSMGGFASTAFGTKYPGKVKGIVLSGALTRYTKKIFGDTPINLPSGTYLPNELGDGVCSNPEVVSAYVNDPLVEKQISVDLLNNLIQGVEWLKANAQQFIDPVFIMHGANDGLISEEDSRIVYGDIASTDKSLKIYAQLMHEIFNETCRDEVIEEAISWIEKRV